MADHITKLQPYNLAELQLLLAAYTYELFDTSLISDFLYDTLAIDLAESMAAKIPGYAEYTGGWIVQAIDEDPELDDALYWLLDGIIQLKDEGEVLHHTFIAHALKRSY